MTDECGNCGSEDTERHGYQQRGAHGFYIECLDCGATSKDGGEWRND